MEEVEPFSSHL